MIKEHLKHDQIVTRGVYPIIPIFLFLFCTSHNFFPLYSVQIIIIPACCLLCVL